MMCQVWVYNVHLNASRKGERERVKEISYLLRWMKSAQATNCVEIVVGDFNMEPKEKGYSIMRKAGFKSAMKQIKGKEELTYPSGLRSIYVANVGPYTLDYIWFRGTRGGKVKCISAQLVGDKPSEKDHGLYPSDHRGIQAEFKISGMAPKL